VHFLRKRQPPPTNRERLRRAQTSITKRLETEEPPSKRFAGSPSAAHAAWLLASHAEDRGKDFAETERWPRLFLTESPHGELAAGARARLLAALLERGAQAEAEDVARDYLRLRTVDWAAPAALNPGCHPGETVVR
jgi:hypothetical protein